MRTNECSFFRLFIIITAGEARKNIPARGGWKAARSAGAQRARSDQRTLEHTDGAMRRRAQK